MPNATWPIVKLELQIRGRPLSVYIDTEFNDPEAGCSWWLSGEAFDGGASQWCARCGKDETLGLVLDSEGEARRVCEGCRLEGDVGFAIQRYTVVGGGTPTTRAVARRSSTMSCAASGLKG